MKARFLWFGIALAALFWLLDAAIIAFVSGREVAELLFAADREDMWIRWITAALFVFFGAVADAVVAQRRRADEALRQRLEFEGLIARLSTRFIGLPVDRIDREIYQALEEIGTFTDADRSFVAQLDAAEKCFELSHEWCRPGIAAKLHRTLLCSDYAWGTELLRQGDLIYVKCLDDLPGEAAAERALAEADAVRSFVFVTLRSADQLVGMVGFDWVREEKAWSGEFVALLRFVELVGQMIVNTLRRQRAEQALRESERRFQLFSEAAFEGIVISREGVIADASERFAKMVGYDHEDLVGMPVWELIASQDHDRVAERIESGYAKPYEILGQTRDGSLMPVEVCGRTVPDGDGKVRISAVRDISDRRTAEAALRESEERFRTLFENAAEAVVVLDVDKGYFVDANQNGVELFGMERDSLLAVGPIDMSPETQPDGRSSREVAREMIGRALEGETPVFDWVHIDALGNEIPCEIRLVRLPSSRQRLIRGSITDVSVRRQAEQALSDYQTQLRSLATELSLAEERVRRGIAVELHDSVGQRLSVSRMKLGALHEALSASSHESLVGEIQTLLDKAIDEARSIVFQLSPPVLYDLGFEPAVEWLVEQMTHEYGIEGRVHDDGREKPLAPDVRVALFQMVRELLLNVVKHAQAGRVEVTLAREDGQICINVADDGVGFRATDAQPPEDATSGFGLFSIRERLGPLGGSIEIESGSGAGSRIRLVAPLEIRREARVS